MPYTFIRVSIHVDMVAVLDKTVKVLQNSRSFLEMPAHTPADSNRKTSKLL